MRTILTLFVFSCLALAQLNQEAWVGYPSPFGQTATNTSITASTHQIAHCGSVQIIGGGSNESLTIVGFPFGAVTKTGGSTVQVSLQDVSLTSGPPIQPDLTADQSYTIANADAGFVSNVAYEATLGTPRANVNDGDLLCVVWEFASFAGSDSVVIPGSPSTPNILYFQNSDASRSTDSGSTWTRSTTQPTAWFQFASGKLGRFASGFPFSFYSSSNLSTSTTPDEIKEEFTVSAPATINAIFAQATLSSGTDFTLELQTDGSATKACNIDANAVASFTMYYAHICPFTPVSLTTGHTYSIVLRPSTTSNLSVRWFDLPSAAHRALTAYGTNWESGTRVDGGGWTNSQTRHYFMGYRLVSAGGTGGGGGSYATVQ